MNVLLQTLFAFLFLAAISIAAVGVTWQLVKPIIEKEEVQYFKDLHDSNTTLE